MPVRPHCASLAKSLEVAAYLPSSDEPLRCSYVYGRGLGRCALIVSIVEGQILKTDVSGQPVTDSCEGAVDIAMTYLMTPLDELGENDS